MANSKKEIKCSTIWNKNKMSDLKALIRSQSQKQSEDRKLKNELLAIRYRMEDYHRSSES